MADTSLEGSFEYLEALYRRPILSQPEAGLRRISYLLGRLDNPHTAYKSVHVTGTCGKGSTTTMIGSILQSSGYRTGLFRSPHLETYRERIAVDGASIDESAWLAAFDTVRPIAD